MSITVRLDSGPGHRFMAVLAALFLLAGLAACLVCEMDRCSQEPGHDECQCRCVCAIAGLPGMMLPSLVQDAPLGFDLAVTPFGIESTHLQSLFRPPRV